MSGMCVDGEGHIRPPIDTVRKAKDITVNYLRYADETTIRKLEQLPQR
jgi:hypothetical protein